MRRAVLVVALCMAVVLGALPAFADVTAQDVAEARNRLREVAARLEERVAAYDEAVLEESRLRERLDSLTVALSARERELVLARRSAKDRAASMYMTAGAASGSSAVSTSDEMIQAPARYVYLQSVSETDREVVNRLEVARRDYEQQKALVDEAVAAQEVASVEAQVLLDSIYEELEEADAEYRAVKAEWEEQERERIARELFLATSTTTTTTTAPPTTTTTTAVAATSTTAAGSTTTSGDTTTTTAPPTTTTTAPPVAPPSGTMVCPVDGATTFRDSWGDPRSGGRTHKGTDMMAPTGTPLVAIETGYIYRISNHYLGGLGIYVHGESGSLWYYAHNSAIEQGIEVGDQVVAGQRIAYVGYSGNASPNYPHVHFAWIPNADWVYKNPYPIVAELCL